MATHERGRFVRSPSRHVHTGKRTAGAVIAVVVALLLGFLAVTPAAAADELPVSPVYGSLGAQGSWAGSSGSSGYVLGGWNTSSDLASLPGVGSTVSLVQGGRWVWASATGDVRAPQSPDQSSRRAATWYHANELRLQMAFPDGFVGDMNLYALDWDGTSRREAVTVSDGVSTWQSQLTSSFHDGAWMRFPLNVSPGGTVMITVSRTSGLNAVLSAITFDPSECSCS